MKQKWINGPEKEHYTQLNVQRTVHTWFKKAITLILLNPTMYMCSYGRQQERRLLGFF